MPAKKTKVTEEKFLPKDLPKEIPSKAQTINTEQQYSSTDVKTLLAWTGPGRPFRKRGRQFFLTSILITLLVEILLFLFSQYLLMLVVLSLLFLSFVLATVAPKDFHYRISTEGITVEDHSYLWIELYDFYFKKRENTDVLHVRTKAFIPGELTLTLGDLNREHIKSILLPYLPYRETVKATFMEKSGDWLAKNFPLEPSKQK